MTEFLKLMSCLRDLENSWQDKYLTISNCIFKLQRRKKSQLETSERRLLKEEGSYVRILLKTMQAWREYIKMLGVKEKIPSHLGREVGWLQEEPWLAMVACTCNLRT